MEYVIPIIVVVLLVAGFVTFLVLNAAEKGGAAAEGDPGPPGIGADEQTPLGDTTEHSDTEPRDDGERRFGRPHETSSDPDEAAHVGRPGEGEGSEHLGFEGQRPRR
jgi:hypothetical protein